MQNSSGDVSSARQETCVDEDPDDDTPHLTPNTGDCIEFFWHEENRYYSGEVTRIHEGQHRVTCNDGDVESMNIAEEKWRFSCSNSGADTLSASAAFELQSSLQSELKSMFNHFTNEGFQLHDT